MTLPTSKISIIVPCYNAEETIAGCLEALLAQTYPAHEIIVVDDRSSDSSPDVVAKYAARLVSTLERAGAGGARALGAREATGDILAFIDSDCLPPIDWLERIARAFAEDASLGGIGGRYVHKPTRSLQGRLAALEEAYVFHFYSKKSGAVPPTGGNSAFTKAAWNKGRSWRELHYLKGIASGEDSIVAAEVMLHSKVRYLHDLRVLHVPRDRGGYLRRHYNRGYSRSSILSNKLTPAGESNFVFEAYGGWPLLLSTFCLGAAPFMMLSSSWGPWGSGALLAAHYALAHKFFSACQHYEAEQLPVEARSTALDRLKIRLMLTLRTLMWVAGGIKGSAHFARFKILRAWNIAASIAHFWRPGRISKLFFFVTSKCNARCDFCFNLDNVENWKARANNELTLEEITKIARGFKRLPYLTMSGGEPFVRTDLAKIVEAFHSRAKTQWVTIPTNAALTRQVIAGTTEILNRCPGIFLTIQVSLDALGEEHDRSRKLKGGFERAAETLRGLAELRATYSNLRVQIATCYDDANKLRFEEIVEFCRENFEYDQQMLYLIRKPHTLITAENRSLVPEYIERLRQNEEREWASHRRSLWSRAVRSLQGLTYRDLAAIKLEGRVLRDCFATQKFVTLWDDGKITPCEVLEKNPLGSIRDHGHDFYQLKKARSVDRFHREEIVAKSCNCDWICAPSINMLYDPATYKDIALGFFSPAEASSFGSERERNN